MEESDRGGEGTWNFALSLYVLNSLSLQGSLRLRLFSSWMRPLWSRCVLTPVLPHQVPTDTCPAPFPSVRKVSHTHHLPSHFREMALSPWFQLWMDQPCALLETFWYLQGTYYLGR